MNLKIFLETLQEWEYWNFVSGIVVCVLYLACVIGFLRLASGSSACISVKLFNYSSVGETVTISHCLNSPKKWLILQRIKKWALGLRTAVWNNVNQEKRGSLKTSQNKIPNGFSEDNDGAYDLLKIVWYKRRHHSTVNATAYASDILILSDILMYILILLFSISCCNRQWFCCLLANTSVNHP